MQIQIVAQRQLFSNTYSCDSGSSLTTFQKFPSHTLMHMCVHTLLVLILLPLWASKLGNKEAVQFHVFHLPGTSDGSETFALHCTCTQAVQPSVGNTSIPLKAFLIGISPDFSVSDTVLQRDFLWKTFSSDRFVQQFSIFLSFVPNIV